MKYISLILVALLALSLLTACADGSPAETETQTETETATGIGTETETSAETDAVTDSGTDTETEVASETTSETETTTETESETLPAPTGKIEDPTNLYGFTSRKHATYFKSCNSDVTFNGDGSVTFTYRPDGNDPSVDAYVDIAYLNMMRNAGFKTTELPNAGTEPDCRAVVLKIGTNIAQFLIGTSFSVGPDDASRLSTSYTEPHNGTSSNSEYIYLVYDFSDNYFFQGDWLNTLRIYFPTVSQMEMFPNGYIRLYAIRFYETTEEACAAIGKSHSMPEEMTPEALPTVNAPAIDPNATAWEPTAVVPANGMTVQTANDLVADIFTDYTPRDTYHFAEQGDVYMPAPLLFSWEDIGAETYRVYISRAADMSDPLWMETVAPMTTVKHLMTGTNYYWQVVAVRHDGTSVVSPVYTFTTEICTRACDVEGISNIRDMGGYQLTETTRIRQGMLYRAATLDNVTAEGIRAALYDYGIRTDLDLRAPGEGMAGTGSPLGSYVRYINISGVNYALTTKKNQLTLRKEFEVLANPDNYPILFHCTAGRDRTGTLAFLVGALLGESEEQLHMEYELTFLSVGGCGKPEGDARHVHDMFLPEFERMMSLLRAYAPTEESTLAEAAEAYLLSIGVSAEDIQSVRDILIEEMP